MFLFSVGDEGAVASGDGDGGGQKERTAAGGQKERTAPGGRGDGGVRARRQRRRWWTEGEDGGGRKEKTSGRRNEGTATCGLGDGNENNLHLVDIDYGLGVCLINLH